MRKQDVDSSLQFLLSFQGLEVDHILELLRLR